MKGQSRPGGQPGRAGEFNQNQAKGTDQPVARPLKPRRRLFVALMVAFVGWVGLLLVMYFTTVDPHRARPEAESSPQRAPVAD